MDFSSAAVSPSSFPGLTSLSASLGSCFCLFPLLKAAGKVLLELFHGLPCSSRPLSKQDELLQEGFCPQPKEEPPAAAAGTGADRAWQAPTPRGTSGQGSWADPGSAPWGGVGVCSKPIPPIPVWEQPHGSPSVTLSPAVAFWVSRKPRVTQELVLRLWEVQPPPPRG